jgi:hypothetical protein
MPRGLQQMNSVSAETIDSCYRILFRQPATRRPQPQLPRLPYLPRSPPRTVVAHRVPLPTVDRVTAMAPVQTDPTIAFECSPPSRCCDDRLDPPNTSRSSTPHGWCRRASSLRIKMVLVNRIEFPSTKAPGASLKQRKAEMCESVSIGQGRLKRQRGRYFLQVARAWDEAAE